MNPDQIEQVEQRFKHRYNQKKLLNILISVVIVTLGVSSVIFIWNYDCEGVLTFRWMTVDGTIFTTLIAFCYVVINVFEIARYTELTSRIVYFMRLAAAVAESLIIIVVLLSQLPCFSQHMHIFRYDMFNMHLLIPALTVASFVLNDSPIGKLNAGKLFHGTWFVTLYAVVVISLILVGIIPEKLIPYAFMDVLHMPALVIALCFVFVYGMGFLLSWLLSRWNRKLSWLWFRGVASPDNKARKTKKECI